MKVGEDLSRLVGDGQNWIWTEWERRFKPFGFVPILDFLHALTHVYAAATAGRPITSAHRESTVKLLNRRVKGSEKYWTERGAEALLQLRADHLSTSQPMLAF